MPIIIILFIVAVFIIIKFYRSHKHLIKFVIKALVGLYIWLILGAGLDKYDDNSSLLLWVIFYIIAASGYYAVRQLTFKFWVDRYINTYLAQVLADHSRNIQLTEASFFKQPKAKKLLSEKKIVDGKTSREFMQERFRNSVFDSLKNAFQRELFSNGQVITDRVFFYYEFYDYELYCDEQHIDLVDVLSSFNIIQTGFTYVPGSVFFSNNLLERMQVDFIPFISKEPKLSDVPFSSEYLENTMYSNETLSPYISQDDLAALASNRELFEEDFIELYHGVANEDINRYVAEGKLNVLPNPNDDKKQTYSLKHEDENGIIQEEYGQSAEQHRVTLDIDLPSDQLDDLDGCPA